MKGILWRTPRLLQLYHYAKLISQYPQELIFNAQFPFVAQRALLQLLSHGFFLRETVLFGLLHLAERHFHRLPDTCERASAAQNSGDVGQPDDQLSSALTRLPAPSS